MQLRDDRGWNQSEAADMSRRKGHPALTRQVLLRLERGQTKNPEPEVMRAVAALYGLDYADLVRQFVALRFGVVSDAANANQNEAGESKSYDLLRPTRDQFSRLSSPGDSASATESSSRRDRVSELEAELRMLRTQYREVRDAARAALKQLGKVAAHLGESPAAAAGEAKRGRHDRRTAR
jgi:transcriptional regulator with XRE-family HTH domain